MTEKPIYFVRCEDCGYIDYDRERRNAEICKALHSSSCGNTEVLKSKINLQEFEIAITREM